MNAEAQADPALLRLPAPGLRGTWARAYSLLTRLVAKIGWDELLKTRSAVFVMEEEYRMQKAHVDGQGASASSTVIHEDGSVTLAGQMSTLSTKDTDDNASTKGVRSVSHSPNPSASNGNGAIPTIRISTESQREGKQAPGAADEPVKTNGVQEDEEGVSEAASASLEKPIQAAAGEGKEDSNGSAPGQPQHEPFSFSNKRLCERWLDNLFMVLYEVSRLLDPSRSPIHDRDGHKGPPRLDHLPCRSGTFQDPARCIPQNWDGVGNLG